MKKEADLFYVKRTQRDYSLSFKLQVLSEVESEELSIKEAFISMVFSLMALY